MQNNKCQMERMTELERFIAPLQFFKLWKIQSFETNTFTQSNNNLFQSGSSFLQKTCVRWILIHLQSEFHVPCFLERDLKLSTKLFSVVYEI